MKHFVVMLVLAALTGCTMVRDSFRIATFNAYLLSPIFRCLGAPVLMEDCLLQTDNKTEAWAEDLAAAIVADAGQIDVLALNEVWDEDARQILVDRLSAQYQPVITKIDSSLLILDADFNWPPPFPPPNAPLSVDASVAGEDSGLMLFVRHGLVVDPLPDATHRWGDGPDENFSGSSDQVAFIRFAGKGVDTLAAKGVALVRLRDPADGRIYNIVLTHMQADYPKDGAYHSATRDKQFSDVETLIRQSLPGLERLLRDGEQIVLLGDLNVPFLKGGATPAEWTQRFGDSTSFFGSTLHEKWLESASPQDRTVTNTNDRERFDYILSSRAAYVHDPQSPRSPCVQHITVPVRFADLQSDHNMVHADINRGFWHCNPGHARKIDLPQQAGSPTIVNLGGGNGQQDVTRIAYHGAMQWFRVDTQGSGVYSIGVPNPQDVAVEIFLPENMTTPRAPYYALPNSAGPTANDRGYQTQTFVLPSNFFIRVRAVNRTSKPDYSLYIRRHACSSKIDACPLVPEMLLTAELSALNEPGSITPQNEAWFRFDAPGTATSGAPQTIKLTAALQDEVRVSARLEDYVDTLAGPPLATATMTNIVEYSGPVGEASHGYLVVRQSTPAAQRTPIHATMASNLHYLKIGQLICHDETNPELGSDDVFSEFSIDGVGQRVPASGEIEFDCDNSDDPRPWDGAFDEGIIRFINRVGVRVQEGDDVSADDESAFKDVLPLPPGALAASRSLRWSFDDGDYELFFDLMRRLNKPAAIEPAPSASDP